MLTCLVLLLLFLQELGQKNEWVSELIFSSLFVSFMLWSFSPFVTAQKRFYTAVLFSRLLMVLVSEYSVFNKLFCHQLDPLYPLRLQQVTRSGFALQHASDSFAHPGRCLSMQSVKHSEYFPSHQLSCRVQTITAVCPS